MYYRCGLAAAVVILRKNLERAVTVVVIDAAVVE